MNRAAGADQAMLESFLVERGFRVELAAAEPMVSSPVAMAFDENGRLFVVEMRDYPGRRTSDAHLGRVRLLDSPGEDGVYRNSTIYADNLPLPSAIACYAGGVFVAAAPDILYLKATHGGGADVRKVVLTGFGGKSTPNAQGLPNNFNWGLDCRIHGATAGIGGLIFAPGWSGTPVSIDGSDFSFNPRTLAVETEAGPAESGLTFDNFGRQYVSDFSHPLRQVMYDLRDTARNPFFLKAVPLRDVGSPATGIFQYSASPPAPANGNRATDLSRKGAPALPGVVPGWLRQSQGVVIYRGDAFPSNYFGNVFIPDPETHIIHRALVGEAGLEMVVARPANEPNTEFLISKDASFRPVQMVNGPDGALYVADMQQGSDHGRIYRIVPDRFTRPKAPQLSAAGTRELVVALAHTNGWYRDTALRLLFERQDAGAAPLLAEMAQRARLPMVRLQALNALAAAGGYRETNALKALRDVDAHVRCAALKLCKPLVAQGEFSGELWEQFRTVASDPALPVRCQLAYTLGDAPRADKVQLLSQILNQDLQDVYVQTAVLSSLAEGGGNMLAYLMRNSGIDLDPTGRRFLRQLCTMIGMQGHIAEVTATMNFIANAPVDWQERYALLGAVGEGLHRTSSSLALIDPQHHYDGIYGAAWLVVNEPDAPELTRVEALRLVAVSPYTYADTGDWLLLQCTPQPLPALQTLAMATLGRYDDPQVFGGIIGAWPSLTPFLRQQALTALLGRANRVAAVIDAIGRGRIPAADVGVVYRNLLRTYRDANISRRAVEIFGPLTPRRPEVMKQFKGAVALRGSAEHGRQLYLERCVACHHPDATGHTLGPNLTRVKTLGREKVLEAMLEPNSQVAPRYAACVAETKDGELLLGIKAEENADTITLHQAGAQAAVWPRLNIELALMQTWSLMPEGLEQGLQRQDMADLLDYLMTTDFPSR